MHTVDTYANIPERTLFVKPESGLGMGPGGKVLFQGDLHEFLNTFRTRFIKFNNRKAQLTIHTWNQLQDGDKVFLLPNTDMGFESIFCSYPIKISLITSGLPSDIYFSKPGFRPAQNQIHRPAPKKHCNGASSGVSHSGV
eukprot:CAMPEP_0117455154 /NCGR_PEP_ID=MMETSP0759-20121206/11206_1 /TAXON_ID=63605 /ORGANISM="Percolomonas cosmopolitus, Strain WS" /LENGTH=139 /DNA_ID=CAMNT_0005248435 /DNA_START=237 /DNA_END=653 /DNA_ORIENTATION=-